MNEQPGNASGSQNPRRILVGEDNPMNQRVIGAFLKSLGTSYEIAGNGQEVIEHLSSSEFALILMDIQMPVMDGLSAIRLIRSGATPQKDIPIIVITANAMDGDRDTYLEAGANDYLAKPLTLDAIRKAMGPFDILKTN